MRYNKFFNSNKTPQSEPIPGSNQVKNSAGGYSFQVDCFGRLDRFLILGTEGGSYYASEQKLTVDNAQSIVECLKVDGIRCVKRIVEISVEGRAPKNDAAIFALAMASKLGDDATRAAAREALPKVCRTGTHLFQFAECIESFGGWGRGTRNAVAAWYNDMPINKLSLQVAKYQQRNGWSHRDLMRLAHPYTKDAARNSVYKWVVKGELDDKNESNLLRGFEAAKKATSAHEIVSLIKEVRMPHECIPTQFKNDPTVQEALLEGMPMTALIRNLGNMTKSGLLSPLSKASREVVARLTDKDALKEARIHPLAVLAALMTYKAGRGMRGSGTWEPVGNVVDALDDAFYESFKHITPTNKNIMLAIDVSASMTWGTVAGVQGLDPRTASAVMAMAIARSEKNHMFVGFSTTLKPIDITPKMRLDAAIKEIEKMPMGGTDCAQPMIYAEKKGLHVDGFVVLTDNETWAGNVHPSQALRSYRKKSGVGAKSVVVGMTAGPFTIADPNDAGMMDVVGFDTAAPAIISDFFR